MALAQIKLTDRPGSRLQIAQAFFGPNVQENRIDALQGYFAYYNEELHLLRQGISEESWQTKHLATETYEDVFHVVRVLRRNADSRRPELRQQLSLKFRSSDDLGLNRSINLTIRLWLMINVQEPEFRGLRHEATSIQWDDESTLRAFFTSLFPLSRWAVTAQSSRLGPHFTAVFMQSVCGLKIEWTTSLHDHLRLDRRRKALKIFPYKCHLQALMDSQHDDNVKEQPLLPLKVLQETVLSLDLLFPFWDSGTVALLTKEKQNFHEYGPFEVTGTLTLLDFHHWRDRLLELHEEIFQSPPVSWAQLWRDRRNPQQFWTFWVAMMILVLTVFSTAATIIQAWASLKALNYVSS